MRTRVLGIMLFLGSGSGCRGTDGIVQSPTRVVEPQGQRSEALVIADRVANAHREKRTIAANVRYVWFQRQKEHKPRAMVSHGTVIYEKSNRYSFRFDNGDQIVSDGRRTIGFTMNGGALVAIPAESALSTLAFIYMEPTFYSSLRFRVLSAEKLKYPQGNVIEAVPKVQSNVFDKIMLYVTKTSEVESVVIVTPEGPWAMYKFRDRRYDVEVNAMEFLFESPPAATWVPVALLERYLLRSPEVTRVGTPSRVIHGGRSDGGR
jgi:outer membrane lipoprotein-sorting protein